MTPRAMFGLIAVVALGLFIVWFAGREKVQEAEQPNVTGSSVITREGTVISVSLEEMMVDGPARITIDATDGSTHTVGIPSMGRPLCAASDQVTSPHLIAPGDFIEVEGTLDEQGAIVPCERPTDYLRVHGTLSDAELGLSFVYRKGPNGYIVGEPPMMSMDPEFVKGYDLMLESDYMELQNSTEPREGPPTIQVRAYRNVDNEWSTTWPGNHPMESNIELSTEEPEDIVIGGANAVKYTVDGLYPTLTYVVAHGSYVFVFTGAYLDENSPQRMDIETVLESVTFIPEEG